MFQIMGASGIDAIKMPEGLDSGEHNFVQDFFTSRRSWPYCTENERTYIFKILPDYIKIYMRYHSELREKKVARQLYQCLTCAIV